MIDLSFIPLSTLATVGAYMGIVGGIFNCTTSTKYKIVGFTIWLVSNCVLLAWTYVAGEYDLLKMYIFFFITSATGLYSHVKLFRKQKVGVEV